MLHYSLSVSHWAVPTSRPRHVVTETDALAQALDTAAARWPELTRPRLLARLALEGHRALEAAAEQTRSTREATVRRYAGIATDSFDNGYLERLRAEWTE